MMRNTNRIAAAGRACGRWFIAMTVLVSLLGLPLPGLAHPGHGTTDGWTITHYFIEPDHAIYTWPLLAVGGWAVYFLFARKAKKARAKLPIRDHYA